MVVVDVRDLRRGWVGREFASEKKIVPIGGGIESVIVIGVSQVYPGRVKVSLHENRIQSNERRWSWSWSWSWSSQMNVQMMKRKRKQKQVLAAPETVQEANGQTHTVLSASRYRPSSTPVWYPRAHPCPGLGQDVPQMT
jgi:hypothetical protein